jgi:hypothetical protein
MNGGYEATRIGMPALRLGHGDNTVSRSGKQYSSPIWSRCSQMDQHSAVNELAVKAYLVKRTLHE